MQGVDRPHHISTEALECRVRPAAGSHTKRLGEAKTVRECWGYLRRAHERWGSQARGSGASQHWGAGAVPGPGFESGKRFFSRGVFTRPKREKESDGCPPPLHPPPSGMQAYAVACMPQSTRRQLHLHRRLRFLPASPPSSKPRPPPRSVPAASPPAAPSSSGRDAGIRRSVHAAVNPPSVTFPQTVTVSPTVSVLKSKVEASRATIDAACFASAGRPGSLHMLLLDAK